jgi:branched-chain amino acid transport system ATP-binding protein
VADAPPLLQVQQLSMRFGGLTAVNALSFVARAEEITAVIGPNGAGKTTVFNCITGFYRPSSGRIVLQSPDGPAHALERMPGHAIARRARVARTFQNIRLFAGMTALENLLVAQHNMLMPNVPNGLLAVFGLGGFRHRERDAIERARSWLAATDLVARADDPAGALPYGAQRRPQSAGKRRAVGPAAAHQAWWLLDPADRARHGRGDAHQRPRGGAGPWPKNQRRSAGAGARRPRGDRRLSRHRR